MKKLITIAVLLTLTATGALAQDYIYTTFNFANRDLPVPPSPCQLLGPAQPVVYDTSVWLIYTCIDNSVVARRFFHPIDNVNRAQVAPSSTVTLPPPSACPGAFVAGKHGGCVPADHPLAGK